MVVVDVVVANGLQNWVGCIEGGGAKRRAI